MSPASIESSDPSAELTNEPIELHCGAGLGAELDVESAQPPPAIAKHHPRGGRGIR